MKRTSITICFLFCAILFFAQPRIKYDTAYFDYGQIVETGTLKKEFPFTNIGNEPLVISRAYTGDGGSYAEFPKEPIAPGKKGIITFIYNGSRVGPIHKNISLNSNAYGPTDIKVRGEIIYRKTKIEVDSLEKNIGTINFKCLDSIKFQLTNIGSEKLHLDYGKYDYPEADMFYCNMKSKDSLQKKQKYSSENVFVQGERVMVTVLLRNVYGNTGAFERKLFLVYNSHDTLTLKIKGFYAGKQPEWRNKVFEESSVLFYENDKLVKREIYNGDGELKQEDFFEGSYIVRSKRYGYYPGEKFYKKGVLISHKKQKKED